MPKQAPATTKEADDALLKQAAKDSQGPGHGGAAPVNAPAKSATRPAGYHERFNTVDQETLDRMHALREQDMAAGTRAPGTPFLKPASEIRTGSGTAMAINDGATAVHGLARSAAGQAVGQSVAGHLSADPAKFVASAATVVQGVSQIVDANDSGRQATYEVSKRGYEKSSINREKAFDALRSLNMQKGDELTEEERENRSHVIRHAYKTSMLNIAKGLKTGALAKTTRNQDDLLNENLMKHTSGGQTDLLPGTVADETHVVTGSMYGNAKRKYNDGDSQKLSPERKTDLEALNAQKSSLEEKRDYEKSMRGTGGPHGRYGQSVEVYDPSQAGADDAEYFMEEKAAKDGHVSAINTLKDTAKEELGKRKKETTSWGITSSKQVLLAGEQTQHDDSKAEYDSAASGAVKLREAHLKRHTETYNELHKKTPWKINKAMGTGATALTPEETAKKDYAKARMTELSTPHTLDNLSRYMKPDELARATAHDRNMKNLESVRDTGLTLDQHDEMAEHKSGLADIAERKKTGLSKGDNEELEETNKNIGRVRDGQREHNETVLANPGGTVDAQGRLGGLDHVTNDTSAVRPTMSGQAAQAAVASANVLRTGANILGGKDKNAQKLLDDGKHRVAVATATFGMAHQVVAGVSAALTGAPISSELAVAPVTGLGHGIANVLEGAAGAKADEEERNKVQRELTDGTRRKDTRKSPVNWSGSTDHGQEPADYSAMLKAGLTESDANLSELSSTYADASGTVKDGVASAKATAKQSLEDMATPLINVPGMPEFKAPEMPEFKAPEMPKMLAAPKLELPDQQMPTIEAHEMLPAAEKLPALPEAPSVQVHLQESELKHLEAPEAAGPEVAGPEVTGENEQGPEVAVTEEDEKEGGPESETEAPEEEPEEAEEWFSEAKEKAPEPTHVVEPATVHKPKLDLAQIRAAGRKSTAAQAGKHHDPTSQVSDQTKREYTSSKLNQYSWKTMKTSGQRIRRGAQNKWKRAKKFGKRMGSRISRFFRR